MALRGKKPKDIQKRLKVLFYGAAGVGKTTASLQFPNPYVIDTEKGAENKRYKKLLEESDGVLFQTNDYEEIVTEIKSLLTEKHSFRTVVVDSLSPIYHDLVDKGAAKGLDKAFGGHYTDANKKIKRLTVLLLRLDMNVIITAHPKNQYGPEMTLLGHTFDCYQRLDHLFDLVVEVQQRAENRVGIVKKSRVDGFTTGENFPFSYAEMSNRYGKEILEKEAVPQMLATNEQLSEIDRLTTLLKVPSETIEKWLSKGEAETFAEMQSIHIQKCIDQLTAQLTAPEEKK